MDLEAARKAWIEEVKPEERPERERSSRLVYKDERGRYFDFHALRGQFVSNLARAGVHPKVAQQLARHSTINLTMGSYTHLDTADLAGALQALPLTRQQLVTQLAPRPNQKRRNRRIKLAQNGTETENRRKLAPKLAPRPMTSGVKTCHCLS